MWSPILFSPCHKFATDIFWTIVNPDYLRLDAPERHIGCQNPQTQASRAAEECPANQWVTIDSNHKFNIAPNLPNRNFVADQTNQKHPLGENAFSPAGQCLAFEWIAA